MKFIFGQILDMHTMPPVKTNSISQHSLKTVLMNISVCNNVFTAVMLNSEKCVRKYLT